MTAQNPEKVEAARKLFFDEQALPVDQVSHAILRSWVRCADMGLDAARTPQNEPPSASRIRELHEKHEAIRRISRPELDALYNEARELSGIVILTNAQGEILDALGDAHFVDRAAKVSLRPGAQWSEGGTGTNAIGTAIAERRAVSVNGAEHYFRDHKVLSCAATPIMDPRGAVIGVLDISTPASVQGAQVLGLVRMAVEQIEHRLFVRGFDGCRTLRFQTDPNLLGVVREGILVLKDDVVVAANRRGLSLIGQNYEALDRLRFDDVFDTPLGRAQQGHLTTHDGRDYVCKLEESHLPVMPIFAEAAPLQDIELDVIRRTLDQCGGNVSAAAKRLGIHRSTIYRRMSDMTD